MAPTTAGTKKKAAAAAAAVDHPFRKRIKAKVGKKAIQPQNVTDTNFKATSLVVRTQRAVDHAATAVSNASAWVSSRGRSWPELVNQLQHHPAPAVRIAAAKGLYDILLQQQQQQQQQPTAADADVDPPFPEDTHQVARGSSSSMVQRHLSLWIQVCAGTIVDDEAQVRTIGLAMLQSVLDQLRIQHQPPVNSSNNHTSTAQRHSMLRLLQPFGRSLVAFVSSALNSLDVPTVMHGAAVVHVLATAVPPLLTLHVPTLLPAFGRILALDKNNHKHKSAATKPPHSARRKRKNANQSSSNDHLETSSGTDAVHTSTSSNSNNRLVQALVALLETTTAATEYDEDNMQQHADTTTTTPPTLMIHPNHNGRACQALVLVQSSTTNNNKSSFSSLEQQHQRVPGRRGQELADWLPLFDQLEQPPPHEPEMTRRPVLASWSTTTTSMTTACTNVLIQLRDLYVEYSQWDDDDKTLSSVSSRTTSHHHRRPPQQQRSGEDLVRLHLVIRAIRLVLWQFHASGNNRSMDPTLPPKKKPEPHTGQEHFSASLVAFTQQCHSLATLLLHDFRFVYHDDDHSSTPRVVAGEANAEICQILMRMSETVAVGQEASSNHKEWMKQVAWYVQSVLQEGLNVVTGNNNSTSSLLLISKSMLGVLRHLLLRRNEFWQSSQGQTTTGMTIPKLTQLFCKLFFPAEDSVVSGKFVLSETVARSEIGRSAALLAAALFESQEYSLLGTQQAFGVELVKVLDRLLPLYVVPWKSDFPQETAVMIGLLQNMVRRLSADATNGNLLIERLKLGLEPLLVTWSASASTVGCRPDSSTGTLRRTASVLDECPPELQRTLVSFITFLGAPTETTVQALGNSCARCHLRAQEPTVSPGEASFITWSMHAVRKSMRIQTFLGFLFDSTGLMAANATVFGDSDVETERTFNFRKALAMDNAIADTASCLVECGTRKALPMVQSILLMFMKSQDSSTLRHHEAVRIRAALGMLAMFSLDMKNSPTPGSIFDVLSPDFAEKTVDSISRFVHYAASATKDGTIEQTWMRPMMALLSTEEIFCLGLVERFSLQLENADSTDQAKILAVLLLISKDALLENLVVARVDEFLAIADRVHAMFTKGSLEELSAHLVAHLKVTKELAPTGVWTGYC